MKQSPTLWPGLLVCIMETLVPEDASKTKDEVEGQDNDEVCILLKGYSIAVVVDGPTFVYESASSPPLVFCSSSSQVCFWYI